jgi:DNA primase
VLALDADAAGGKATLRSLEVARETLDREYEVRFNARGLVQYEGRLKADIRVVTLPAGQDPDNLIRANPAQWPRLLAEAKPVVAYVLDVISQGLDLADGKAKSAAAQQILPLINDIADPVERDHYRHLLGEKLHIEQAALRQAQGQLAQKSKSHRSRPQPPEPEFAAQAPAAGNGKTKGNKGEALRPRAADKRMREGDFLRQCLQYPHVLAMVNQMLRRYGQPEVSAADFERAEDKALLEVLYNREMATTVVADAVTATAVVTNEELWDDLDLSLSDRIRSLLLMPAVAESKLDRLPDTLVSSVLSWRLERLKEHNKLFGQLLRDERDADASFAEFYGEQIRLSHQLIQRINEARAAMSPVARRRTTRGRA